MPRGRALLRKKDERLVIYMDKVLFVSATKRQIGAFFDSANPLPVFRLGYLF